MLIPFSIKKQILDIAPLLTTAVITPHGMTDLIHAENENNVLPLFRINIICAGVSMILHIMNMDAMTNFMFMTSSAIHFRHDFPLQNEFLQICASSLLVLNSQNIGIEWFLVYMCFIHVPNHYKIYKQMIKENLVKSGLYISLCGAIATLYFYSDPSILQNDNVFTLSKALIISHIIYEELYTKNNTMFTNSTLKNYTLDI